MLENSRKRARKSKLEVREGVELEEATVLYMEALETKIKDEPMIDVGPTTLVDKKKLTDIASDDKGAQADSNAKMEFCVKIEVEEFDEAESNECIDSSVPTNIIESGVLNEHIKFIPIKVDETALLEDIKPIIGIIESDAKVDEDNVFKEYVTNRPMVLKTTERFMKSDQIADRLLAILARNYAGRVLNEPLKDAGDNIVYRAMEQWQTWHLGHSAVRDTPLIYKCYICGNSWWYMHDFREHINKHLTMAQFDVTLETNNDECSLICYQMDLVYNDVDLPMTNCDRCGKKAEKHAFVNNDPYKCVGCKITFSTCTQLQNHENQCTHYKATVFPNKSELHKCSVCIYESNTHTDLNDHMLKRHTVRSDLVTAWDVKMCNICTRTYILASLHVCVKKTNNYGCNYCGRSFQKKIYKEIHMANYSKPTKCRVCDRELSTQCMEYSHLLQHTDRYALMYKCIQCTEGRYYPDEFSIIHHTEKTHNRQFEKKFKYLEMVILPKQCLEKFAKAPRIRTGTDEPKRSVTNKEVKNSTIFVPSMRYRNTHKSLPPSADVVVKQEADIKTETEEVSPSQIQISDITSLQDFIKFKTEPVEEVDAEDLIIIEDKSETITLYSSDDSDNDFRLKYTGQKRKKLVRVACVCGYVDFRSRLNAHKLECTITQAKRAARRTRAGTAVTSDKAVGDKSDAEEDTEEEHLEEQEDSDEEWGQGMPLERSSSKSGLKYTCHCKKVFVGTLAAFRRHKKACVVVAKLNQQRKLSTSPPVYSCTKCDTDFNSLLRYCKHFNKTHFYNKYTCPQCYGSFAGLGKMASHVCSHVNRSYVKMRIINVNQEGVKSTACKVCKQPVERRDFFKHWESHLNLSSAEVGAGGDSEDSQGAELVINAEYTQPASVYNAEAMQRALVWLQSPDGYGNVDEKTCVFCTRRFARKNDSKRHVIEHLLQEAYAQKARHGELRCQICLAGFPRDDRFKHHMREHASLPVYQCDLCGKSFSDSSNFCKHRKVHGLSLTCCTVCDKRFHNENHLARHMEMHERTKPIVCDLCGKISFTASAHKKHVRYTHERHRTRVLCPVCRAGFARLKDKWDHMWLVHRERKFKADCPMCSAGFRRFADVKAHVRVVHQRNVRLGSDQRIIVYP